MPLEQHRTCVSGRVCAFDGLLGQHLSVNDVIQVLETCGVDPVIERFPTAGQVSRVDASGAAVTWGSDPVSAAGGRYRLCWCTTSESQCSLARDFATDFGELTVIGTSPMRQDRTCMSGQACSIEGLTGSFLSDGDLWMAMDTCGQSNFIPRFSHAGVPSLVEASGSAVSWGSVAPTAAGGQYRLCWCSAGFACVSPDRFVVDAGGLVLLGMSPLAQDRTCSSGQACFLRGFQGLFDSSLEQGAIMALDTCGIASAVPRFSQAGTLSTIVEDAGVTFWTQVAQTTAGGVYRLCWCSPGGRCELASQFQVDMGSLAVLGPTPLTQDRTCITGQTCKLYGIGGLGLPASDRFAVLDTCGEASLVDRLPASGIFAPQPTLAGSITLSFDGEVITASAGSYRLCWCSPSTTNLCSSFESFRTDFGSLTVLGPRPLYQDRTCVAGQTCFVSGVLGSALDSADAFVVQDTCGLAGSVLGFPAFGTPVIAGSGAGIDWGVAPVTAAAGVYRLCWCSGLAASACSSARDFEVDVGALTLVGIAPLAQSKTCLSGLTCEITGLTGQGLSETDEYLILETCGVASGPALAYTETLETFAAPVGRAVSARWVSSPLQLAGGDYRLCWCAGEHFSCDTADSFRVDAGTLTVIGVAPIAQHRTCVSGRTCFLQEIAGYGLNAGDVLFAVETCGQASALARFPYAGRSELQRTSAGTTFSSLERITSAGGVFRLCWCHSMPDQAFLPQCVGSADAKVDAGSLYLIGANPLSQDRTCVSGLTCRIAGIEGQGFQEADRLFVMDTCGVSSAAVRGFTHDPSSFLENNGAAFSWGSTRVTAAGGIYELCWCGSTDGEGCDIAQNALVTLGSLTLVGVNPLSQDRTCVSGQTCSISGLGGQDLPSVGSALLVLETCGLPSLPRGFGADVWPIASGLGGRQSFQSTAPLTAAGGVYRLCWCPGILVCKDPTDFNIDAGGLTLIGPDLLHQEATCVHASDKSCTFSSEHSWINPCALRSVASLARFWLRDLSRQTS